MGEILGSWENGKDNGNYYRILVLFIGVVLGKHGSYHEAKFLPSKEMPSA